VAIALHAWAYLAGFAGILLIQRVQTNAAQTLKAAVIGAGAFGRHHASKYTCLPNVRLTAVADVSADVRRQFQVAQGVRAVSDFRDLLGEVDLVSVCSPAITHASIVRAFLNSGAHVLVEKPIATDLDEADALIALATVAGRVLTVGHQERFVFAGTGLLDLPKRPLEIDCWRMGPWTGRGADVSVALDLMIHDLDLVHRIVPGEVRDVAARARALHGREADEICALVKFENGTRVRLDASRISPSRSRGMRIIYEDGLIEIDFLTRKVRNTTPRPLRSLDFDDPLGRSIADFVRAASGGNGTLVRPEEARRALRTALAIEESAERLPELAMRDVHELHAAAR
jgi:predicted dehydrogenase